MHRLQIQLTEEQFSSLKRLSTKEDRSLADLIREAVDARLDRDRNERKLLIERSLQLAGRYSGGPGDVSLRHDDYLAEAILESKTKPQTKHAGSVR